jgi:outer membrane protein OmpA-like peptidoglycan-associated protein
VNGPRQCSRNLRRLAGKKLIGVAALLVVAPGLLLTWAMFWPTQTCADPGCARKRFALAIEVDAFAQVPPIDFTVTTQDGKQSLQSIFRGGGIDLNLTLDQLDLPFKESSGALDRADLYQFVSQWRDRQPVRGKADARMYALLVTSLVSDNGESLFGIMFDVTGREGFAVAPRTTLQLFGEREPDLVSALQLRTFAHELLHALNRDHLDAAQMSDGRLTLEAPTRCISEEHRRQWSLREPPLLALSPDTIRFFQSAASRDILPGIGNSPFQRRRASATECDDARANSAAGPPKSRWQLGLVRIKNLLSLQAAAAAEGTPGEAENEEAQEEDARQPAAELTIQALPSAYPLGYPIALRVVARNTGEEPLPIEGRLNPGYGMLHVEYQGVDESQWHVIEPLSWYEPTNDADAMLQPGARTEQTVPIYFGEDGWTFKTPGEYRVRARLQTGGSQDTAVSAPISIRLDELRTPDDREASKALLDADGGLDDAVGRLLVFGGRIGKPADLEPLEATAENYGHTALGGALRLTLLSQRLRRPIDPLTGERPPPDFGDARDLIQDTCTDSGIAALTHELLQQQLPSLPDAFKDRSETAATAWDGTTSSRGESISTYSNPALSQWGPSLHFCFNESELRNSVRTSISTLARRLKRERPQRIVLVGHGDHAGTCRFNDTLALRRAQAVKSALVASGVARRSIEVVSLGERRPLDFAASEAAHGLNRRVEILIERRQDARAVPDEPQRRIMPACPAR